MLDHLSGFGVMQCTATVQCARKNKNLIMLI